MSSAGDLSSGWFHSVCWNGNVRETTLVLLIFQMWKKVRKTENQGREWGLAASNLADGVFPSETTVSGFARDL